MAAPVTSPSHFPVPDDAHKAANIFLGLTIPLLIISTMTLSTRVVLKSRSGIAFGWEDCLIVTGFLLAITHWALLTVIIAWCSDYSIHSTIWATFEQIMKLSIISQPVWCFSIGFIKLSVVCLLLRFQHDRSWRLFLHFMICSIATVAIGSGIFSTLVCIPLNANWDSTHAIGARCVSPGTVRAVSNFVSGFSIATDMLLSLFPLTFLVHLRRPFFEKVLISILMGIGLMASSASITKAFFIQKWVHDHTSIYFLYMISAFAVAELLIGCTAACLPYLKSPIQTALANCGIDFDREFSSLRFWGSTGFGVQGSQENSTFTDVEMVRGSNA